LRTLKQLGTSSLPAIAVGVANALYHFFFFSEDEQTVTMRIDTMVDALELYSVSLHHSRCLDPELEFRDVLLRMCSVKFFFIQMLASELGGALAAQRRLKDAANVLSFAADCFRRMRELPFYATSGVGWTEPRGMAFNHELYPNFFGPIWPKSEVPLAAFLEQHFTEFHSDLAQILADKELFNQLGNLERNAEGLSVWPPGQRKHIELADLREEESWKAQLCHFAPKTCSLLRSRPEIAECPRAAVMVARLSPGAWLKPHFGNSRRLVVHLGLAVPTGRVELNVGTARGVRWRQGEALVFDDTHVHDARHEGENGERFILHMMICHPCEQRHLYPKLAHEACEFQDPIRSEVSRAVRAEMDTQELAQRSAQRMIIPRSAPEDV